MEQVVEKREGISKAEVVLRSISGVCPLTGMVNTAELGDLKCFNLCDN